MRIGGRFGFSATAADIAGLNASSLYVISNGHGQVKIGVTKDPISRIRALHQQSPASALDFAYIGATSSEGFDIERAARSALAGHGLYGDWSSVPPETAMAAIARAAQKLGHPIVQLSPDQVARTAAVARAQEAATAQPKRRVLTGAQKVFLLIVMLAVVAVVMLARFARI